MTVGLVYQNRVEFQGKRITPVPIRATAKVYGGSGGLGTLVDFTTLKVGFRYPSVVLLLGYSFQHTLEVAAPHRHGLQAWRDEGKYLGVLGDWGNVVGHVDQLISLFPLCEACQLRWVHLHEHPTDHAALLFSDVEVGVLEAGLVEDSLVVLEVCPSSVLLAGKSALEIILAEKTPVSEYKGTRHVFLLGVAELRYQVLTILYKFRQVVHVCVILKLLFAFSCCFLFRLGLVFSQSSREILQKTCNIFLYRERRGCDGAGKDEFVQARNVLNDAPTHAWN